MTISGWFDEAWPARRREVTACGEVEMTINDIDC